MFLADKTTFTLDMISGLEMYAIMKAHEAKRYNVVNSVKPKFKINEYDLPLVKEVYEEIEFTMATQGFKMDNAKTNLSSADNFQTTRNGIVAYGIYSGDKFEVMEGSQIDFSRKPYLEKYELQRIELLKNGNIINKAGNYILNTTLDFNTPSGATEFVLGGAANGWVEWKNKDSKTLDEIFRK